MSDPLREYKEKLEKEQKANEIEALVDKYRVYLQGYSSYKIHDLLINGKSFEFGARE